MHLLIAYSLLVKQELQNKRFDILSTAMQLMEEPNFSNFDSNLDSRVIDLTANDKSIAEFVDFSKDPEVLNLCSSSSDSSICSSDSSVNLFPSKLMPCSLLQAQSDSNISTSRTSLCSSRAGGRAGLPHLQFICTLIQFCPDKSWGQGDHQL